MVKVTGPRFEVHDEDPRRVTIDDVDRRLAGLIDPEMFLPLHVARVDRRGGRIRELDGLTRRHPRDHSVCVPYAPVHRVGWQRHDRQTEWPSDGDELCILRLTVWGTVDMREDIDTHRTSLGVEPARVLPKGEPPCRFGVQIRR